MILEDLLISQKEEKLDIVDDLTIAIQNQYKKIYNYNVKWKES